MAAATDSPDPNSILIFNAGSSSLKFTLFAAIPTLPALLRGEVSELGTAPHLVAQNGAGKSIVDRHWPASGERTFADVLDALLARVDAQPGHVPCAQLLDQQLLPLRAVRAAFGTGVGSRRPRCASDRSL